MFDSRVWPAVTAVAVALAAFAWLRTPTEVPSGGGAAPGTEPSSALASEGTPSASPSTKLPRLPLETNDPLHAARSGDLEALKRLELEPPGQRTIEACLAIAEGHDVLLQKDVEALGRSLLEDPESFRDSALLALLHGHAFDPSAAPAALRVAATLPDPVGPDLLYAVSTESKHAPTRSLAEDLLAVQQVRERASKALLSLLKLKEETRCERIRAALGDVLEHADRRATGRLDELSKGTGCGKDAQDDCFPCLRGEGVIDSVRRAIDPRPAPRPWYVRRR